MNKVGKMKRMKNEDRELAERFINETTNKVINFYNVDYQAILETAFIREIIRTTIIFTVGEILKLGGKDD